MNKQYRKGNMKRLNMRITRRNIFKTIFNYPFIHVFVRYALYSYA